MSDSREDFHRTVLMLCDLALYAHRPCADQEFIKVVGPSLAASLPRDVPSPGTGESPEYPRREW
ncbi:hypothetical protein AB0M94_07760 [Streptomyces xanthochromogenes]|uniref:hypothetical protein n=1 Tax=Streptomyces xanthochromogenes TaxID=67384 RepID=UPI003434000B